MCVTCSHTHTETHTHTWMHALTHACTCSHLHITPFSPSCLSLGSTCCTAVEHAEAPSQPYLTVLPALQSRKPCSPTLLPLPGGRYGETSPQVRYRPYMTSQALSPPSAPFQTYKSNLFSLNITEASVELFLFWTGL